MIGLCANANLLLHTLVVVGLESERAAAGQVASAGRMQDPCGMPIDMGCRDFGPGYAGIRQDMLGCARICWDAPGRRARTCRRFPECWLMRNDCNDLVVVGLEIERAATGQAGLCRMIVRSCCYDLKVICLDC
eukprot:364894-Chlamydomonas_euryale.AAC.6